MAVPRASVVAGSLAVLAGGLLVLRDVESKRDAAWENQRIVLLEHQKVLVKQVKVADSAAHVAEAHYRVLVDWAKRQNVVLVDGTSTTLAKLCAPLIVAADTVIVAKEVQVTSRDTLLVVRDSIVSLYRDRPVKRISFPVGGYYDVTRATFALGGGVEVQIAEHWRAEGRALVWAEPSARPALLVGLEYRF
jgi:hypothetical protein